MQCEQNLLTVDITDKQQQTGDNKLHSYQNFSI